MINAIDHVVILVNDLDAAVADYGTLGFTVVPGGEHADGLSHNALISFEDGSYLELIAFKRPPPAEHLFSWGYKRGEGLVTFALLPTDIANDVEAARMRGLELDGPFPGGRMRPDGQRVEWQIAGPRTPDLPFLCGDVTSRELRVPGGDAIQHPNGAAAILEIAVGVTDLPASIERYRTLLGVDPLESTQGVLVPVGRAYIRLVEDTQRANVPLELSLTSKNDSLAAPGHLDMQLTHGARIVLKQPPHVSSITLQEEYSDLIDTTCPTCGGECKVVQQKPVSSIGLQRMRQFDLECTSCGEGIMLVISGVS